MTTPSETTILSASSTDILSSTTSSRGTNTRKPPAAFAEFGTNTATTSRPVTALISCASSDVWNPSRHTPLRGYSSSNTLRNDLPEDSNTDENVFTAL